MSLDAKSTRLYILLILSNIFLLNFKNLSAVISNTGKYSLYIKILITYIYVTIPHIDNFNIERILMKQFPNIQQIHYDKQL